MVLAGTFPPTKSLADVLGWIKITSGSLMVAFSLLI
jgi:hypothetical protein